MATGWVEKRSKDGYTVWINYGRQKDPKTGKITQVRKPHTYRNITKAQANQILHDKLASINKGQYIEPSDQTLGDYLDTWLEATARPRVGDRTYEDYEGQVKNHIKPHLGYMRLSDVQPEDVRRMYMRLTDAGLSASTIGHTHVVLNSAISQAVKDGDLYRNIMDAVDPPRKDPKERTVMGEDEVILLLSSALTMGRPRRRDDVLWLCTLYELFRTALATGMRRGELLALKWAEVNLDDPERSSVEVKASVVKVKGEDGKRERKVKPPKSKKGVRTIPIDTETSRMLSELRDRNPYELVFCKEDGSPLDPSTVTHKFSAVAKSAGIDTATFHSQRHTYATILAEHVDPFLLQDLMGHASISTTRIYTHIADERKRKAANVIGSSLPNLGEHQFNIKTEDVNKKNDSEPL